MVKTGLANIGLGIVIALIGAVITAVSYEAASGGGTYVVTYGAIIVGAWRVLLGLFQLLRGAFAGNTPVTPVMSRTPRVETAAASNARVAPDARNISPIQITESASSALRIVGGVMIAEAALRLLSLGMLLARVPSNALFSYIPALLTAVVLPAALMIGGIAAGLLLLRNLSAAVPFAAAVCFVGLLFQAYALVRLLAVSSYQVPWMAWAFSAVHLTAYIVCLIVLARSSSRRAISTQSPIDAR